MRRTSGTLFCATLALAPLPVPIMQIQGTGDRSPLEGVLVETTGVVTQMSADGRSFWLQDPVGDGDAWTSDGLFVFGGGVVADVEPGDLVRLVDRVGEFAGRAGDRSVTELAFPQEVEVLGRGKRLPQAVELRGLPDVSIPEAIEFWERLEGMRVSVRDGTVVAPTSRFDEIVLVARGLRRGWRQDWRRGHVFVRPLPGGGVDYNPERILVEGVARMLRLGDRVRSLVGVADYAFGSYRVVAGELDARARKPPARWRSRGGRGRRGELAVASWNLENLFDLVNDPGKVDVGTGGAEDEAALAVQLSKLAGAIRDELRAPAILVVQEVENRRILRRLADLVNAGTGTAYDAVSFESSDRRGIEVGLLWDAARVTLVDAYPLSGPLVEEAFGPGSESPGREPLVGVFLVGERSGRFLTVVGIHFKSKLGDDALFGAEQPPRRPTERQRALQARAVRDFVERRLERDPAALVLVAGDLNDFAFPEPGEGADHPAGILEGLDRGVPMLNLVRTVRASRRYSFNFEGNSQVLDHAFASPALVGMLRGVDFVHFNADWPAALHGDASTVLRASDHDPLEMRFRLRDRRP